MTVAVKRMSRKRGTGPLPIFDFPIEGNASTPEQIPAEVSALRKPESQENRYEKAIVDWIGDKRIGIRSGRAF